MLRKWTCWNSSEDASESIRSTAVMESVESIAPPLQDYVITVDLPQEVLPIRGSLGELEPLRSHIKAGKVKEAKMLIRESNWSIMHPVRSQLWKELCLFHNQEKTLVENYYWDTVKQLFGQNCLWVSFKRNQKAIDCLSNSEEPGTQPHLPAFVDTHCMKTYHLNDYGESSVSRVISVVGFSYPAITFSPTLYPITSLLLHYIGEEDCYNALSALLSWKQGKFVIQTKLMYETSWRTMLELAKKFAKAAYGNISKYLRGTETMEQIFEHWLSWIFKHLPFSHLVRVMDCFLFEGNKVLYRVAMAILIFFRKQTVKSDSNWAREASANGISSTLAKFSQEIPVTPEKLLKVAFGIRALSQSEINRIFLKSEMYVKSRTNKNTPATTFVRSRSTEGIPTSQSQFSVQTYSHTLNVQEPDKHNDVARARSMGLYPFSNFSSQIVDSQQLLVLWSWLPPRITMYDPKLIYTTEEHGCSLTTFYSRVEDWEPTVLVIKTTANETFGAYCSTSWKQRNTKDELGQRYTYFGTGESFVFTLSPISKKYPWIALQQQQAGDSSNLHHSAELFMAGDSHMLTIGGGDGQAIFLDEDIRFGRTERCQTFNNSPLCSKHDFECKVVEVFGFA